MSGVRRFFTTVLFPFAASIERHSREWLATCSSCGFTKSIWERGGIRWLASGTPRRLARCPSCERVTGHRVHRSPRGG